jgi:hypothetical protein
MRQAFAQSVDKLSIIAVLQNGEKEVGGKMAADE